MDKQKTYYIYKITNILSGKIYIGQTIQPKVRWRTHKYNAKHKKTNQYIHHAMHKHGIDNFTYEIISEHETLEECNLEEAKLVKKYKTQSKEYGYNIKTGGRKKGWKHSEETKSKLSENWKDVHGNNGVEKAHQANRGRKLSKEHVEALRKANIGNKRLVGHKQSQETINKRVATIAKKYGSKVCNAPNCNRTDGYKFKGIRYCNMHVQRMEKHGTTD